MKNKLLTILSLTLLVLTLAVFNACEKPVDLVTEDALSGGLLVGMTSAVPYKVGVTTDINLTMNVPKGTEITTIELYKKFYNITDGKWSNEALLTSIDISGANSSAALEKAVSVNYASLSEGLTIDGVGLPASADQLSIGDKWEVTYVSKMADGRAVHNGTKTVITIANPYAGTYTRTGELVHQTAGLLPYGPEEIDLVTVDASTVKTIVGYFENPNYYLTINVAADYSVICGGDLAGYTIGPKIGEPSSYDPATKTFTLNYYTVTSGTRDFTETLVAVE